MAKKTEVHTESLPKGKSIPLAEIGDPEPIEKVAEDDMVEAAELEAFMNDIVTILVHDDATEGTLPVICPNVNSLNQPIIRGVQSKVKRKYVEALARTVTTKYEQKVVDPSRPENIQMEERKVLTYPFAVIHDPHPNGKEWLESIVASN